MKLELHNNLKRLVHNWLLKSGLCLFSKAQETPLEAEIVQIAVITMKTTKKLMDDGWLRRLRIAYISQSKIYLSPSIRCFLG
jgi:hypothetical protein